MIVFEVAVNGKKLCEAGIDGLGVLDAMLFSARRLPHPDDELNRRYPPDELVLKMMRAGNIWNGSNTIYRSVMK